MRDEYTAKGVIPYITGFESNKISGRGLYFNIILSNGQRSTQRDEEKPTNFTHMMPVGADRKIRSVDIYNYKGKTEFIVGFQFFDKDRKLIWQIGAIDSDNVVKTVLIAENEVIVGVIAKQSIGSQSMYTDWQFQVAKIV